MAGRKSEPWFWKARSGWFVTIKGKRHRLGADKDEADRQFHLLMAGEEPEPVDNRPWLFASEVADQFQTALRTKKRSETTIDWYCQYLDPFKQRFLTSRADLLTIDAVEEWINAKWTSQPSRRAAWRAVKAAFRRAVNQGKLLSPLAGVELPGETSRELVVGRKEYKKVLAAIKDPNFADLVQFVWLTGARPQEAVIVEDSQVDLKRSRIVLPPRLVKGKKRPRVLYLSADALELVKKRKGNGFIFQTTSGKRFTKDIVRQRFRTLQKKLGVRYCLYHFRHGFAHRSLAAGNDALTVATLLGHSAQTLARVYSHLNQADSHLRAALKKTK